MKRIGLFGGTFNPVHLGHLHAAEAVRKGFPLDRVDLIPSALPPHKTMENLAPAEDRLEMIRRSIANNPGLSVSTAELSRSGPSYTIDTVHYYRRHSPDDIRLFLIMGIDAFLEIDTWKSYHELLRQISLIVLSRPKGDTPDNPLDAETVECYLKDTFSTAYAYDPNCACFYHPEKQPVHLLDIHPLDISSTDIRARVKRGRSIQALVAEPVNIFIQAKGLYL